MKRIKHFIEAVAVIIVFIILLPLPIKFASWLGGFVARSLGKYTKAHKYALINLHKCFPNSDNSFYTNTLDQMWDNLGRMFAEYPKLYLFHNSFIGSNVDLSELSILPKNTKCILVAPHYGNFELAAPIAHYIGMNINLVYRPANNIFTDYIISKLRLLHAKSLIQKGVSGVKSMLKVLDSDQALGMLIDQKMKEGEKFKFFGYEALTTTMHAKPAFKTNAPIYLALFKRTAGTKFKITLHKIEIPTVSHPSALTQQINDLMEHEITKDPGQWFWVHRRWNFDYKNITT